MKHAAAFAPVLLAAGCLGPMVPDDPGEPGLILPEGSAVPSIDDDPIRSAQIAANDGVEGTIPRLSAFADGAPVHYWDFGPAPDHAAPLFVLVRETAPEQYELLVHNTIIQAIPGDPGYSPWWAVFFIVVTDAYDGERLTSVAAVQEAERLGLVEPPIATDLAVDCPIVAAGVDIELGGGVPPRAPPSNFYFDGVTVHYFDYGFMPLIDKVDVPELPHYVLRREGGEPLSEPIRNVDLTGDGDTADSNDVLGALGRGQDVSPLCRTITVAVPQTTASIDTSGNETIADIDDALQLFDPDPVVGTVVAYQITDTLRVCVQQLQDGEL